MRAARFPESRERLFSITGFADGESFLLERGDGESPAVCVVIYDQDRVWAHPALNVATTTCETVRPSLRSVVGRPRRGRRRVPLLRREGMTPPPCPRRRGRGGPRSRTVSARTWRGQGKSFHFEWSRARLSPRVRVPHPHRALLARCPNRDPALPRPGPARTRPARGRRWYAAPARRRSPPRIPPDVRRARARHK